MTTGPHILTVHFWRSRRSAAIAGIIFGVLLLIALTMARLALADGGVVGLRTDPQGRAMITISLHLVPFAGIAFLWFIGVVRDQLGDIEDRLFSTVFVGSGLLFLAMLFTGTVSLTGLLDLIAASDVEPGVLGYGQTTTQTLISVYAMRMAAVFTLSVSTVGLRTRAMPRWLPFLGYAVALTLLVAAGQQEWIQLVFPAWVLLVSLVLFFVRPRAEIAAPDGR